MEVSGNRRLCVQHPNNLFDFILDDFEEFRTGWLFPIPFDLQAPNL